MKETFAMAACAYPGRITIQEVRTHYPAAIFAVERNIDTDVVVYEAEMKGNALVNIRMFWTKSDDWNYQSEVSPEMKDMFYGVQFKRINRGLYRMRVNCIDDRKIDLHIKKSGKVVAKFPVNGRESKLGCIHADITTLPPSVNSLTVCGQHKKVTEVEVVPITEAMRAKVNMSRWFGSIL